MRDTIDATVGVVDDTATIIACSDLTKVGTTNEFVSSTSVMYMIFLSATVIPISRLVLVQSRSMRSL